MSYDLTFFYRSFTHFVCCRYSTGFGVTGCSVLIHEFYSREVTNPIHLTVDTTFTNGEATLKAFVSVNLSLGEKSLAAQFQEIPAELQMSEAERVGCRHMLQYMILLILIILNNICNFETYPLFFWVFLIFSHLLVADELLKSTVADKIPSELEGMESTLERLLTLIDDVYKYVDDVVVRT